MNNPEEKSISGLARAHALSREECLQALESDREGLEPDQAARRLENYGENRLPESGRESLLKRILKQFNDILIYILLAAALITALLGHYIDTGVILGVVIINALIGFFQEGKAEQALAGIRNMLTPDAEVRRGGNFRKISAASLVPGDIIRLKSGDKVPADVRLLDVQSLRVEESPLTGESQPVGKQTDPVSREAGLGDRASMAFSGSLVTSGRATALVVGTGLNTEIGKISRMVQEVEEIATPLTRQMNRFSKKLAGVILFMSAAMFFLGWIVHGSELDYLFFAAIGFAVASIPEGLPAIMSITLALGVKRMAMRKAIVRRLPAVETLGSVDVICTDKTGTLTRNEMTARSIISVNQSFNVSGTGYVPEGHINSRTGEHVSIEKHLDLLTIIEIMAVCNDAEIYQEDGQWKLSGDPTEGALRTLGQKAGFDHTSYRKISEIPFESEKKFMATLCAAPSGKCKILLKGAPDRLLDRCSHQLGPHGEVNPLDREFWEERMEDLARDGQRIIAAAWKDVNADHEKSQPCGKSNELDVEDVEKNMVFAGIVGMVDPPRPEAVQAIKVCRQAGIRVKMITGDFAATAAAIGREMGIGEKNSAVSGAELEEAGDEQFNRLALENDIFARTSPEHKLRLVKALQKSGHVVAMTGDGVNDAPALKRADIGVAMGIKGTEATKEAAEIVLTDDNFATIEQAVEEGRTIYDNLLKAVMFILPTNGAEGLVILTSIVLGFAVLPLTPVQILWVNMVTAVTLAIALAFEPSEPGIMSRPPRKAGGSILNRYYLWRIAFVSVLIGGATLLVFHIEKQTGLDVDRIRTMCVNTLVIGEVFYLFNSRFLKEASWKPSRLAGNRAALAATGILVLLQLVFVYVPFMNFWFGSSPLQLSQWLLPLGTGVLIFVLAELEKGVYRRLTRRKEQS